MKKFFIRTIIAVLTLIVAALVLVTIQFYGGQPMGFFSGSAPTNLGYNNGKFVVPSSKPNWVSSTIDKADKHFIAPLNVVDASSAFAAVRSIVAQSAGANIKKESAEYIYAEFKTPGLGFVDDVELALDKSANVIQIKSGSRLGYRDFDLNRKRIETLRAQLAKQVPAIR